MKLKPQQIVGLIAIVVFGGGMIFRLTQPSEREVMERRLASLPRIEARDPVFPMPDLPDAASLPPLPAPDFALDATAPSSGEPDDSTLGSADARDDLYCSAVLAREFEAKIKTDHPDKVTPLLDAGRKLEAAGVRKLDAEGATNSDTWASRSSSYLDAARADYRAGTLRIPVAACVERAARLPPRNP